MTLEEAGYFKTTSVTIKTALFVLKHNQIEAVLLSLNLADGDGTKLAHLNWEKPYAHAHFGGVRKQRH